MEVGERWASSRRKGIISPNPNDNYYFTRESSSVFLLPLPHH
jgi:hypothetical protein